MSIIPIPINIEITPEIIDALFACPGPPGYPLNPCGRCCCCCRVGACDWLISTEETNFGDGDTFTWDVDDTGGYSVTFNWVLVDFGGGKQVLVSASRGFFLNGDGVITGTIIADHTIYSDINVNYNFYRCYGVSTNAELNNTAPDLVLYDDYIHAASGTFETGCDRVPTVDQDEIYNEECNTKSRYRLDILIAVYDIAPIELCSSNYIDVSISGVTIEDCATPPPMSFNKLAIQRHIKEKISKVTTFDIRNFKKSIIKHRKNKKFKK